MTYANYQRITGPHGHLAKCEPFIGNTMRAQNVDTFYYVFSWRECIAFYNRDDSEWYVNSGYWSRTTSKHQNYCRAWMAFNFTRVIDDRIFPPQVGWHPLQDDPVRNVRVRASIRRTLDNQKAEQRRKQVAKLAEQEIREWEAIIAGVKRGTERFNA